MRGRFVYLSPGVDKHMPCMRVCWTVVREYGTPQRVTCAERLRISRNR